MILDRNRIKDSWALPILPRGDHYDLPPGRGQFRLISLFGLLTAGALVAALSKWSNFGTLDVLLFECMVVVLWWKCAQLRESTQGSSTADQTELRAEVKRWLRERHR